MYKHSFTVGGVDMRKEFGLIAESFEDGLAPPLRPRKVVVPQRDGAFDYKAKYYDERELIINCASIALLDRGACRELSRVLARKEKIVRWDEEGKYYIGRVYDPTAIERLAGSAKRFAIHFVCEPFAFGRQVTEVFDGRSALLYQGTARTPTRITITNTEAYALNGITITMKEAINP